MSGFLSVLAQAGGIASDVSDVLFGVGGQVILGSVVLIGLEVPETMMGPTDHHLEAKIQPGGTVFLQAFGPRFPPIEWHGYLEGPDALDRSAEFKNMAITGEPVPLIWFDRYYTVVVQHYEPTDKNANWLTYRIRCHVLRDETVPPPVADETPTPTQDANSADSSLSQAPGAGKQQVSTVKSSGAALPEPPVPPETIPDAAPVAAPELPPSAPEPAVVIPNTGGVGIDSGSSLGLDSAPATAPAPVQLTPMPTIDTSTNAYFPAGLPN
jgi:hypothetical protein